MKRAEEQIIGSLQEHESGAECADLCRQHGMSEGTFYAWKAKCSGLTVFVTLACCRFRGHEDKIVTKELESGYDETEVQP